MQTATITSEEFVRAQKKAITKMTTSYPQYVQIFTQIIGLYMDILCNEMYGKEFLEEVLAMMNVSNEVNEEKIKKTKNDILLHKE